MSNRAKISFNRGSTIKGLQKESIPVAHQFVKLKHSDFDEVRLKLRQVGKGKQTIAMTRPIFSNRKVVIKRSK